MTDTRLAPIDQLNGLIREEQKTPRDTQYVFHPHLHEVLSLGFINFDLNILSKEQQRLIDKYIENSDALASGTCIVTELIQLDTFLGGLTNELYN